MLRKLFFKSILHQDMYPNKRGSLKTVYRYMNDEDHINQFLKGRIRISTLEACRSYENQEMGDKEEAQEVYTVNYMASGDPNFFKKSEKLRLFLPCAPGSVIENCSVINHLPNGFLICTTNRRDDEKFSKDFGRFCIKINDSERFFQIVTQAIRKKFDLLGGHHEKVTYQAQKYSDDELPPGKIGFVKRTRYQWQDEYRFLWLPNNSDIGTHLLIDVPEIKYLCERVL